MTGHVRTLPGRAPYVLRKNCPDTCCSARGHDEHFGRGLIYGRGSLAEQNMAMTSTILRFCAVMLCRAPYSRALSAGWLMLDFAEHYMTEHSKPEMKQRCRAQGIPLCGKALPKHIQFVEHSSPEHTYAEPSVREPITLWRLSRIPKCGDQ